MSGLKDNTPVSQNMPNGEITDTFRRKLLRNWQCLWPRRYVLAFMIFILLLIRKWRNTNVLYTLAHIVIYGNGAHERYPSVGNWTFEELDNYNVVSLAAEIFAQIPGALFIYTFSSHKFILISIVCTSILQMLTPLALQHHSASLLIVLLSQSIIEAPLRIAVISIWRDWAPPMERTKLVVFSLLGWLISSVCMTFYSLLFHFFASSESYYLAGISGLIWALFWYNITSETPQNDPLISERELLYLESTIPSDIQQNIKLKYVPWKSIITSKEVLILCLIFLKMSCSMQAIMTCGTFFVIHLEESYNPLYFILPFVLASLIIAPLSGILADFLIQRFSGQILFIRKCFLCGGFILQSLLMLGTLAPSESTKAIFYVLSYLCFVASLPGFITLPLDLSPRYSAIILGMVYIFFVSGLISLQYFIGITISVLKLNSILWVFLLDGSISIICAALFAVWGDAEEQLWSLTFSRGHRVSNGYRSYPKPDDQDDVNLVQANA